jgi:hypothetical protein
MATLTVAVRPAHNQPQSFPPIHFTAHQVALMADVANNLNDHFARALGFNNPAFVQVWIDTRLMQCETPIIPPAVQRFFNLKRNRKGDFTWKAV